MRHFNVFKENFSRLVKRQNATFDTIIYLQIRYFCRPLQNVFLFPMEERGGRYSSTFCYSMICVVASPFWSLDLMGGVSTDHLHITSSRTRIIILLPEII